MILQYTHASGSGAARYVAALSSALARRGLQVRLICPSDFAYRSMVMNAGVTSVPSAHSLAGARGRVAKARRSLRQTMSGAFAVMHSRERLVHVNFPGIAILAVALVATFRLLGKTVVLTVHDVVPHRPVFGPGGQWLERRMLRQLYALPAHLVVHDLSAEAQLTGEFNIPRDRISRIPHGVDVVVAAPAPGDNGLAALRLALVGSLRENKGVDLAIAAVQRLRAEGMPVELTIAGAANPSESPYWIDCQQAIARKPDGISVMNRFLSDEDVGRIMSESDAILLPYRSFASQSGIAVQSLASGRPILATAQGGLAELLAESGAGIAIEDGTVEAVMAAIRQAHSIGTDGLANMGRAGLSYAQQHLAWDRVAAMHEDLYQRLLAH